MESPAERRGFCSLASLSPGLTPTQLDDLERAIKIGLVDEDALLTYCFNVQRNFKNDSPR